jgi:hypothetical protein
VRDPSNGIPLTEFFFIHFQSSLGVNAVDAGRYQLGVLSDDGIILKINEKGTTAAGDFTTLINSESHHPARMACASQAITLEAGKQVGIDLDYFQGPRRHIALVMMWRRLEANQNVAQLDGMHCGEEGNNLFFYGDGDSSPQQAWQDLLDRGWEPIPAENFFLPDSIRVNPCSTASMIGG